MSEQRPTLNYKTPAAARILRRRWPVIEIVVAATVLAPLVAFACYGIAWLLPWGWRAHVQGWYLVPDVSGTTGANVVLAGFGSGRGSWAKIEWVNVWAYQPGATPDVVMIYHASDDTAVIEPLPATRSIYPDPPKGTGRCDRRLVIDYLVRIGYADNPQTAGIADLILAELANLRAGQLPPERSSTWNGKTPARWYRLKTFVGHPLYLHWYAPYALLIWLGLSVASACRLIRRHRRREAADWERWVPEVETSSRDTNVLRA